MRYKIINTLLLDYTALEVYLCINLLLVLFQLFFLIGIKYAVAAVVACIMLLGVIFHLYKIYKKDYNRDYIIVLSCLWYIMFFFDSVALSPHPTIAGPFIVAHIFCTLWCFFSNIFRRNLYYLSKAESALEV